MNPREVVAAVLEVWRAQDVESTFAYVAEDVVYALHFDEELAPFAGVAHGREAMKAAFYELIKAFDYLEYEPVIMDVQGELVRIQTRHRYLHRRTGEEIAGTFRTIFTVRDGLIVRCEEYVDRGKVEAFMRLTRRREADNDIVQPPEIPKRIAKTDAGRPLQVSSKMPDEEDCE